jgi:hypothetical protein
MSSVFNVLLLFSPPRSAGLFPGKGVSAERRYSLTAYGLAETRDASKKVGSTAYRLRGKQIEILFPYIDVLRNVQINIALDFIPPSIPPETKKRVPNTGIALARRVGKAV